MGNSGSRSPSCKSTLRVELTGDADANAKTPSRPRSQRSSSERLEVSVSLRRSESASARIPEPSDPSAPPTYKEAVNMPVGRPTMTPGSAPHITVTLSAPVPPPKPPVSPAALKGNSRASQRPTRDRSYIRTPMRRGTEEDALQTLIKYDTVLIIDDSSSMYGASWREASSALSSLAAKAGEYDVDGIDVYFLNSPEVGHNLRKGEDVAALFTRVKPNGYTPIGAKLEEILRDYLFTLERANNTGDRDALKHIKPINYIVITDGVPTDDPAPVIVQVARRLDRGNFPITQIGIQFVQVGNNRRAAQYLQQLDDDLAQIHKIRDIVDTTPYFGELSGDALIKILLGGINRRIDVHGAGGLV